MKSKQRHQLKQNELQETLEEVWLFLQKQSSKVISIAVLAVVIVGMIIYLNYSNKQVRAQQWDQLFILSTRGANTRPEDLQMLADQSSDHNFAAFALTRAGDIWLMQAMFDSGTDKEKSFQQAEQAYSAVVNKYNKNIIALGSASMGLGVVYENTGQWYKARDTYRKLIGNKELLGTGVAMLASERLHNIDSWKESWQMKLASAPTTSAKAQTKPAAK